MEPIQALIDAIDEIFKVHENHLYPKDLKTLIETKTRMIMMQKAGFR